MPGYSRLILDEALASGGSRSQLFAEESVSTAVSLDGGRIEDASHYSCAADTWMLMA